MFVISIMASEFSNTVKLLPQMEAIMTTTGFEVSSCAQHSEYTARNDINYHSHASNYVGLYINNDTANAGTSSLISVMSFLFI